jgi:hypothetical protein
MLPTLCSDAGQSRRDVDVFVLLLAKGKDRGHDVEENTKMLKHFYI